MILVVCAVAAELRYVPPRSGVEVLVCGVGPVEAAVATARRLSSASYAAAINAGIAGAFRGRASVGDALLIGEETLADFGLEGGAPLALPSGAALEATARADARLLARCAGTGLAVRNGLTSAQITSTAATAERLAARYDADAESMEGFAVLRAAALCGVRALEVRGISNYVGERAESEWDFDAGARAAARALEAVLGRLTEETERT